MSNKLRTIFCKTLEKKDFELYQNMRNELAKKIECSTCKYCVHIHSYPSYVVGEECECTAGLKCDTVLFSVSNCPKWEYKKMV